MRVACRWLEQRRFKAAIADDENVDDLVLYLAGADDMLTHKRGERRLQIVVEAGGEVA